VSVESALLGDFEVEMPKALGLDREIDVLWVTPKATQLESALGLAPPGRVGEALVVPLLNGVDHVAILRERYQHVLAAAISIETERIRPGVLQQKSPFARVAIAPDQLRDDLARQLRTAGFDVVFAPDEVTLLWEKLAFLAPLALTTTALGASAGAVRASSNWNTRLLNCQAEVIAVGQAWGGALDEQKLRGQLLGFPSEGRTSMQKDFEAGRPLELDAIAGPILRGGRRYGIPTPSTEELVRLVEARRTGVTAGSTES
jgi:2-dehydropantoate 2-reductase